MSPIAAVSVAVAAALAAETPQYSYPAIKGHGRIVRLPQAAEQPWDGSRICVDLTAGGETGRLNPAVEKVARFVNIYAGAGKEPAKFHITVVLHGKATAVALNDASYAKRFKTKGNPNLPLIRKLRQAGVDFFVCGQALAGKGFAQSEVASGIDVAVSALTVNVNRQQQRYAYIPLH